MRQALKARLEMALSSSAASGIAQHRIRGKRLILAYHGIIPEREQPAGERALFVRQKDFAAQLDLLTAIADVTPLNRIDEEGDGRPRVAITFDDGYRGAVCEGVRELANRRLPATIFVVPGRIDGHSFWWDVLSNDKASLDDSVRQYALHNLGGADEQVRRWARQSGLIESDVLPAYAQSANVAELHEALRAPGITIGSHTWSHTNLASLTAAQIIAEIERSHEWLVAEFGERVIPWLAYPYGIDSSEVHRALASASYRGALCIRGGWHRATEVSPFARPRLNVPGGMSVAGLHARLVGSLRT